MKAACHLPRAGEALDTRQAGRSCSVLWQQANNRIFQVLPERGGHRVFALLKTHRQTGERKEILVESGHPRVARLQAEALRNAGDGEDWSCSPGAGNAHALVKLGGPETSGVGWGRWSEDQNLTLSIYDIPGIGLSNLNAESCLFLKTHPSRPSLFLALLYSSGNWDSGTFKWLVPRHTAVSGEAAHLRNFIYHPASWRSCNSRTYHTRKMIPKILCLPHHIP